mmetsp:Transcript_54006/g.129095  ORF Transcript_54006/g.129095 Transcript_54006/m.129095 type:complete len:228 (+) Transcript_54006:446-1129(+)
MELDAVGFGTLCEVATGRDILKMREDSVRAGVALAAEELGARTGPAVVDAGLLCARQLHQLCERIIHTRLICHLVVGMDGAQVGRFTLRAEIYKPEVHVGLQGKKGSTELLCSAHHLLQFCRRPMKFDFSELGGPIEGAHTLEMLHMCEDGLGIDIGLVTEELLLGSVPCIPQTALLRLGPGLEALYQALGGLLVRHFVVGMDRAEVSQDRRIQNHSSHSRSLHGRV